MGATDEYVNKWSSVNMEGREHIVIVIVKDGNRRIKGKSNSIKPNNSGQW